jgi:CO dehydrogenase/acetyl-CoA synthase gamma subunit (corrinoid Fe-S protein)
MREVTELTTYQVKRAVLAPGERAIVIKGDEVVIAHRHSGEQRFAADTTVLVGTKEELEAEIEKRGLRKGNALRYRERRDGNIWADREAQAGEAGRGRAEGPNPL